MCYTALPSTLHQEQDSHAQTKSTTFELKSLNICFSASRVSAKSKSIPQQRELLAVSHHCIDYPFQHRTTHPQKQCKTLAFHWNTNKSKKTHDLLSSLTHKKNTERKPVSPPSKLKTTSQYMVSITSAMTTATSQPNLQSTASKHQKGR